MSRRTAGSREAPAVGILNGRPTATAELQFPDIDRGPREAGVFETVGVRSGRPFLLGRHTARMVESMDRLGSAVPFHPKTLLRWGQDAVRLSGVAEGVLRMVATGRRGEARFHAWVTGGGLYPPETYRRGLRGMSHPLPIDPASPTAGLKCLGYAPYRNAREGARRAGFDEAILLGREGRLAEGAASSLFLVEGRRLSTPPLSEGILAGVTRAVVLALAPGLSLEPVEEPLAPHRLESCEEAFLTSALLGVCALVQLDGRAIGTGRPGAVTAALSDSYGALGRPARGSPV